MKPISSRARSAAVLATGVTAALALSALTALPANAAPAAAPAAAGGSPITGAVFTWGVTDEANAKAFQPGAVNLLSAGALTKSDAADTIAESEWKATDGTVTIQKQQADGSFATGTWAGLRTTPSGAPLAGTAFGTPSGNRVAITAGSGTVDPEGENADIRWTGDFTVALYSGLTQFSVSDPHLVVENGTGTVTATLGGYGTDMNDQSKFTVLPETEVTLATLTGVDVTETGFSADPDYLGVTVDLPAGATAQKREGEVWGSFPQSFVDFQLLTGQSSYWYSSGGTSDGAKVAEPIGVAYAVAATPSITVSKTEGLNPEGETITVTGTGFVPNPPATTGVRPPLAGQFTGAYVTFGTFADTWKPSEGAGGDARVALRSTTKWALQADQLAAIDPTGAAGGILIDENGSFSTTMTVSKNFEGHLASGDYGVYAYAAGGAVYAPFELEIPVTFTPEVDRLAGTDRIDGAVKVSQEAYPSGSDVAYVVSGYTFADALSAAPAAVSDGAPLLLTAQDALAPAVKAELKRLAPTSIVVVGGPNSVSDAVLKSLDALAADGATRITGADRYATSRAVAEFAFGDDSAPANAYVATGANFPDALSASAAAGAAGEPVLLVPGTDAAANSATRALIKDLGVSTVTIAGGPNSVSTGIQSSISTISTVSQVVRLDGVDRFAASIAINNAAFAKSSEVYLATGYNYPDALAGAALAGLRGAPLYVVPTDCVPQGVTAAIGTLAADTVTLLGGPNSLSPAVATLTACTF